MTAMTTEGNYWHTRAARRLSRRGVIRGGALAGAGLAGAALIGCGDDDEDVEPTPTAPPDAPDDEATPTPDVGDERQGGRLGFGNFNDVATFNPIEHIGEGQILSGAHVYDRLIAPRLDEREYVLEAAESVELPDDVTVIFHLNEGMVYQDKAPVNGRAVLAEDIVRVQEAAIASEHANNTFQVGSMESVEATDDRTVVFHLQRPNAYLFTGQGIGHPDTMAIIPSELLDRLHDTPPIGSGPYHLADHQLGVRYRYERNPTYRLADQGLPLIDEREAVVLTDLSAQETAFRAGQLMVNWVPAVDTAERVIRDLGDELEVVEYVVINAFEFTMNARRTRSGWADEEIFEDERIREAFYRVVDQQEYTDLLDNGLAENCPGQLAVGLERYLLDWADVQEYRRIDLDEARSLLDAAGFDFDHRYRITATLGARNETGLQVGAAQLERVGVQTELHNIAFPEWLGPIIQDGRYDFSVAGHPAYDTPLQPLRHHHTDPQQRNNSGNIADPEIDAMIERSEEILDFDEQTQLVKDIQMELLRKYANRNYINSFIARNLRWAYVRDWEVSAAGAQHTHYQVNAWLDA